MMLCRLSGRAVLTLSGTDSFAFLQGLISNDLSLLKSNKNGLLGSVFIGSDGRIQSDGLICRNGESYIIETGAGNLKTLNQLLRRRKLAAKVDYRVEEDCNVYGYIPRGVFNRVSPNADDTTPIHDAQKPSLEYASDIPFLNRTYAFGGPICGVKDYTAIYRLHLALNGFGLTLANQLKDLKVLPQDLALHKIGFISKNKGCYVGQEIMNRVFNRTLAHKYQLNYLIRCDQIEATETESESDIHLVNTAISRVLTQLYGTNKTAKTIRRLVNRDAVECPAVVEETNVVPIVYYKTGFGLALVAQRRRTKDMVVVSGSQHVCLPV
ncbi:folate-binding protein [Babesia caballi]|uniref:Folate-binding protein n=1 Tax=Babesia caballi TaxID=5871 RepID=A0AAV4LYD9_BABCB|nr:folate-binding protein [Babesia caballi]